VSGDSAFESEEHAFVSGTVFHALHESAGRPLLGWRVSLDLDDDANFTGNARLELPNGHDYVIIVRPVDEEA